MFHVQFLHRLHPTQHTHSDGVTLSHNFFSYFLFPTLTARSVLCTVFTQAASNPTHSQWWSNIITQFYFFYFIFPTLTARSVSCTVFTQAASNPTHSQWWSNIITQFYFFNFIFPTLTARSDSCTVFTQASNPTHSQWWSNIITQFFLLLIFFSPHSQLEVFYVQFLHRLHPTQHTHSDGVTLSHNFYFLIFFSPHSHVMGGDSDHLWFQHTRVTSEFPFSCYVH